MKTKIFLALLAAGLVSNVFVFGQGGQLRPQLDSLKFDSRLLLPGQTLVVPGPSKPVLLFSPVTVQSPRNFDTVIFMDPDHMPVVITRSAIERMPVKKLNDVMMTPMPNFIQKPPSVKVIPVRPKKKVQD